MTDSATTPEQAPGPPDPASILKSRGFLALLALGAIIGDRGVLLLGGGGQGPDGDLHRSSQDRRVPVGAPLVAPALAGSQWRVGRTGHSLPARDRRPRAVGR